MCGFTGHVVVSNPDHTEAMNFVSASSALVGLLNKPDIRPAVSALRKIKDSSLGNLLGFLHAFNLRFGPATTPTERDAYHQLFSILDNTCDEILAEAKPDAAAPQTFRLNDFYLILDQGHFHATTSSGLAVPAAPR
jgi:hypothetical protein